ncbi:MAG: hypothetical protein Q4D02_02850 [Clostridia bacterium]|nr:hypothetical protein [Clostridia bacterium]
MSLIQIMKSKWNSFMSYIIGILSDTAADETEDDLSHEELEEMRDLIQKAEEEKEEFENDDVVIVKRSMLARLYSMEQLIKTFDEIFPKPYAEFAERIKNLKDEYQVSLNEYLDSLKNKTITFEIDPDEDSKKVNEVVLLEKEINAFIENDLKFYLISRRIQKICVKLSTLYNTSIRYSGDKEKQKFLAQIERAKESIADIVEDTKSYGFFTSDKYKKEYLIDFVSYADYLIFKCVVRNSLDLNMKEVLSTLFIEREFRGLDHTQIFKDFVLEELENLTALLELLKGEEYYFSFLRRIQKLQNFNYDVSVNKVMNSEEFWLEVMGIEDDVLHCLTLLGYSKDRTEIILLDRFDTGIDENEIFLSVKSQSCLSLAEISYKTQDINVAIVLRILSNLSSEVTYKEIYFILLLFDLLEEINSSRGISGSFVKNIKKQMDKYSSFYPKSEVEKRKSELLKCSRASQNYVKIFSLDEQDIAKITRALKEKNFDFMIFQNHVYLNSFYFQGLENVLKSLNDIKNYNELI